MTDHPEENTSDIASGSDNAILADAAPKPGAAAEPPFTPVRRSMWGHFTHALRHYADFSGRATRAEYWSFLAWIQGIGFLFILAAVALLSTLFFSMVKETVGDGELARYVEITVEQGVPALEVELVESAPALDENEAGDSASGTPPEIIDERADACGDELTDENVRRAGEAWAHALRASYARLAEESRYPALMLASIVGCFGLAFLWLLGTLVPTLAVTWRRLHDIGLSGAWSFLSLLPYVGNLILLVMTLIDSKPGDNRFGPATKYP